MILVTAFIPGPGGHSSWWCSMCCPQCQASSPAEYRRTQGAATHAKRWPTSSPPSWLCLLSVFPLSWPAPQCWTQWWVDFLSLSFYTGLSFITKLSLSSLFITAVYSCRHTFHLRWCINMDSYYILQYLDMDSQYKITFYTVFCIQYMYLWSHR